MIIRAFTHKFKNLGSIDEPDWISDGSEEIEFDIGIFDEEVDVELLRFSIIKIMDNWAHSYQKYELIDYTILSVNPTQIDGRFLKEIYNQYKEINKLWYM